MSFKIKDLVAELQKLDERSVEAKEKKDKKRAIIKTQGRHEEPQTYGGDIEWASKTKKKPEMWAHMKGWVARRRAQSGHPSQASLPEGITMKSLSDEIKTLVSERQTLDERNKEANEELSDDTRRLAGIVESSNSSLLESRLSHDNAEASLRKKTQTKPVKA